MMNVKKRFKSESGFTLIELLVVIGIIAILATIGAVNFSGARAKARDAKRLADAKQIEAVWQVEAAGSSSQQYPIAIPADLNSMVAPANTAYCAYTDNGRDGYVIAVLGIEDAGNATEGYDTDEIPSAVAPIDTLVTIDSQTTVCPALGSTVDCSDTSVNTICFEQDFQ
jgi:prepilin-type N-terminal cleavage/methylation domain-containing protein